MNALVVATWLGGVDVPLLSIVFQSIFALVSENLCPLTRERGGAQT